MTDASDYFSRTTSDFLKSIAILFLLVGHYYSFCLQGTGVLTSAGEWAVILFLMISAMGLTKSYHLEKPGTIYFIRRIGKIAFPLWITLSLVHAYEFIVLHQTHPWWWIARNYIGIIPKENGPTWFISYILYLYLIFYLVSMLKVSRAMKCALLFIICHFTMIIISSVPALVSLFGGWGTYTYVFPLSVCIMAYSQPLLKYCTPRFSNLRIWAGVFCVATGVIYFSIPVLRTPFGIACIALAIVVLDGIGPIPTFTTILGRYSYEIYLLHSPLMVSIGFLMRGKRLIFSAIIFSAYLLISSVLLQKASLSLNRIFFPEIR